MATATSHTNSLYQVVYRIQSFGAGHNAAVFDTFTLGFRTRINVFAETVLENTAKCRMVIVTHLVQTLREATSVAEVLEIMFIYQRVWLSISLTRVVLLGRVVLVFLRVDPSILLMIG